MASEETNIPYHIEVLLCTRCGIWKRPDQQHYHLCETTDEGTQLHEMKRAIYVLEAVGDA